MKNLALIIVIIAALLGGAYWYTQQGTEVSVDTASQQAAAVDAINSGENAEDTVPAYATETVVGNSVDGRDITAYHFGNGDTELLFVGGLHGGYSPNTSAVANEVRAHFAANESAVPEGVRVTVIPDANPDGLAASTRFNANTVDLNRNFDCDWQSQGVWRNETVSGGSVAFSEPEAAAIRDYVTANPIAAAVVYYSAAGGVYASNCGGTAPVETKALTETYANASGYPAYETFDSYAVTGDMTNWLAKEGVPAISVLLTDHETTEWAKNKKGVEAVLNYYNAQ